jgi:hypothetical protein
MRRNRGRGVTVSVRVSKEARRTLEHIAKQADVVLGPMCRGAVLQFHELEDGIPENGLNWHHKRKGGTGGGNGPICFSVDRGSYLVLLDAIAEKGLSLGSYLRCVLYLQMNKWYPGVFPAGGGMQLRPWCGPIQGRLHLNARDEDGRPASRNRPRSYGVSKARSLGMV